MLKATMSWSGGKDSAFALYKILSDPAYEVVGLHTLIDRDTKRVGLHGVREEIIKFQARSLGLPLTLLYTSARDQGSNYEEVIKAFYSNCAKEEIDCVVFGDIFLEDLRAYRETLLNNMKLKPVFPLWKIETRKIFDELVEAGFKAAICSAHALLFDEHRLATTLERSTPDFFKEGVDVCGENGEFHTLVYDGPIFKIPLPLGRGSVVKKWYEYKTKTVSGEIQIVKTPFWFQEYFLLHAL